MAHEWCQWITKNSLYDRRDVIVSNTFVRQWELQPYRDMARELNVPISVVVCQGEYGNIHNVPEETILRMKGSFEF
jgi:hypothetical protein